MKHLKDLEQMNEVLISFLIHFKIFILILHHTNKQMINFLSTPIERVLLSNKLGVNAPALNLIAYQNSLNLNKKRELNIAINILKQSINQN